VTLLFVLARKALAKQIEAQRIVSEKTLEQVQEENITIPVWLPKDFVEYAQQTIREVLQEHQDADLGDVLKVLWAPVDAEAATPLALVVFTLSPISVFQQFDRRLDE